VNPADTDTLAAWLARIEALRAAGDLAAARRELAAFRRQHPDAELPPALRSLLEP
jgi:resuscitation-promoting factor RpfA